MKDFTHLHVHTEYSLLDGFSRIKPLLKRANELGMKHLAITDHGSMFGVIDFFKEAKKYGINPIIGCEVYVASRNLTDKDVNLDKYSSHLVLLAENNEGYQNLIKIVSRSYVDGFYYKPRTDKEDLKKYSKGIIALSACLGGEVSKALLNRDYNLAKKVANEYREIFGKKNYFLELQDHNLPEQKEVNAGIIKLSKELNIPMIASNDVHYINKKDAKTQDILMCIQMQKTVDDQSRMKFGSDEFYLKSREEMEKLFPYTQEALDNTVKIAERCHVDFDFNTIHIPNYEVPDGYTTNTYLRKLCNEGLLDRYGENPTREVKDRLEFEINVIETMGYVEYFLIVWDFINFAKENNIMVGPGRGSAAGSIVAYALKITDIDPIKYQLLFERFLNPERVSMPDIDIDFCYERREEVIEYVKGKYGNDHVAQIITFGTMGAKIGIRDVGRVLDVEYSKVDKIAKEIPFEAGMTIQKAFDINPNLQQMYEADGQTKEIIDVSRQIEGMLRHASTHAAGVVISKNPVDTYVPLYKHQDSITTQFTMTTLEELGLLKMDFLGLRTLTVIRDTLDLIEKNRDEKGYTEKINLSTMEYDDKAVFEMLSEGNSMGVFQLESSGMRNFMKQLKPDNFEDIVAGISLFRPGPMDSIPTYIKYKNNPEDVEYLHEKLKPILEVTYGCLVYQEQVMQVVRDLGGYSYGRSDLVRRAMSKKKMDVMEEERQYFIHGKRDEDGNVEIKGCIENGVSEAIANQIFDEMIDFARYAFNKSHAAAYGVLSYQTAYLKLHYPVEFMSALLTSIMGNTDKVVEYLRECETMKIKLLPPNINKSEAKFSVEGENIRFGMAAIKNVGVNLINNIIQERNKNGEFKSIMDLAKRLDAKDLNKRAIESLIKAGAFDEISENRATLLNSFEDLIKGVIKDRRSNLDGQISLFDVGVDNKLKTSDKMSKLKFIEPLKEKLRLEYEKEVTGIYLTGHPLSEYTQIIKNKTSIDMAKINSLKEEMTELIKLNDQTHIIGGMIIAKRILSTRRKELMAFVTIEDLYGTMEVVVFPRQYKRFEKYLTDDNIILVKGKINIKEETEEISIMADFIQPIDDSSDINKIEFEHKKHKKEKKVLKGSGKKIFIRIDSMSNKELINKIHKLAFENAGKDEIIYFPTNENENAKTKKTYKHPIKVFADESLNEKLKIIVGKENSILK